MDISEKYIEMCEKASELQPRDLEFLNGDCVFYKGKWGMYFKEKFYDEFVYNDGSLIDYDFKPFRLHTQDQLQEMVWRINVSFLVVGLDTFCAKYFNPATADKVVGMKWYPESMEQLLLAYVMMVKYNKTWKDKKWILIKNMS